MKGRQADVILALDRDWPQATNNRGIDWSDQATHETWQTARAKLKELNQRGTAVRGEMPVALLVGDQWMIPQRDLLGERWVKFCGTWPASGSLRAGAVYEHPTSAPATNAPDCSSLPTPTARDWKGRNQRDDETCLPGAIAYLPTPSAQESTPTPEYVAEMQLAGIQPDARLYLPGRKWHSQRTLSRIAPSLLPTPNAWDGNRGPDYARAQRPESGGDDLGTFMLRFSGANTRPPSGATKNWQDVPLPFPPTPEDD
jgi:hypothetical protein